MQTIVPSILMVCISFCSFLVPVNQVPGRMTLCITTLLTLVSMSTGTFSNSPRTAYLKAIDIWLFGCFTFCFAVLVIYCAIAYLNSLPNEVTNLNIILRRR